MTNLSANRNGPHPEHGADQEKTTQREVDVVVRFDDAVSQLRLATIELLEAYPQYKELDFAYKEDSDVWVVAELARVTTLCYGHNQWRTWADVFLKWMRLHTQFDVVSKRRTPYELLSDLRTIATNGFVSEMFANNPELANSFKQLQAWADKGMSLMEPSSDYKKQSP